VGVLVGCVQDGLYGHVNGATVRTLAANGYEVVEVPRQDCCGALHAHGGDLDHARAMARVNIDAFLAAGVEMVVVNAAGCGAAMKEYGTLLAPDPAYRDRARELAARVRDVTELLAAAGPRVGAEVRCVVAYDHPCHLLHAQRIERAPLDVLAAVPGVEVRVVAKADECCGGAGIYGITHPDLGGRIGRDKVAAVRAAGADAVATPNPGCMMQIGAGLRLEGAPEGVVHPIELLDESYRRAGLYAGGGAG
jgi:glycolate oxidase iron-sulfur subunit